MFVKIKDIYTYHTRRNIRIQKTGRESASGFREASVIKSSYFTYKSMPKT